MNYLAVYQKEAQRFPWERRINIIPKYRKEVCLALAKVFNVKVGRVRLVTRGNGKAYPNAWIPQIDLPAPGERCNLGLIVHEVTHLYNYQYHHNSGHQKTFWNCLSLIYHHSRPQWYALLSAAKKEADAKAIAEQVAIQKQMARIQAGAFKKASQEALQKTPQYKMDKLRKRIKRLESRAKRTATLIKSAKRSLSAMERIQRMKAAQSAERVSYAQST